MRRLLGILPPVALLLVAAGCASSPKQRRFSVDLFEQRSRYQKAPTLIGSHAYQVRVRNLSDQFVTIESIKLDLVGTNSEIELSDASQSIHSTLAPGEERIFDMWVTVGSSRPLSRVEIPIDSLRVTFDCRADSGPFVDSDVYPIETVLAD